MKKLLLMTGVFLLLVHTSHAQDAMLADAHNPAPVAAPGTARTAPATKPVIITAANQWQHIEMKTEGDMAYFTYLDGMYNLRAYVTNGDGVELMKVKLSADANGFNCRKLKAGLYFVTLLNENNDDKRAFMLRRP